MRISIFNIIAFLISLFILVWGTLMVTGVAQYEFIPAKFEFLNLPSLAIVIGGILASVFITYPVNRVLNAFFRSLNLFSYSKIDDDMIANDIENILFWQKQIKQDRVKAITELSKQYQNQFEGYLFSILDTNYTVEELRELGEIYIQETYSRQLQSNQIITSMGKTSPVFGMLGTLFGLIVILSSFNEMDALLSGLATALMTTLYGIIIGNFIFTPMAKKTNNSASMQYFRESLILEGIILIQDQKSSLQIYDRLQAHVRTGKNSL
ncbi:MAG: MotA/TolQ/ExbB proton channel family protein [Balneolaceae bacterium]